MNADEVYQALKHRVSSAKANFSPRFFKCGPGEYGAGDQFLGVTVPQQRAIAKEFRELDQASISQLLQSPWHECRLTALLVLVHQFERASEPERGELVEFYLENIEHVNNWDLVDSSAPKILGIYSLEVDVYRKRIEQLAASEDLWRERVAVLATYPHIKRGDFQTILKLAKKFLTHEHDLMHKAVGWMLREVGKQDLAPLIDFLDRHKSRMPRTMLRYAIEKLPPAQREHYLAK